MNRVPLLRLLYAVYVHAAAGIPNIPSVVIGVKFKLLFIEGSFPFLDARAAGPVPTRK